MDIPATDRASFRGCKASTLHPAFQTWIAGRSGSSGQAFGSSTFLDISSQTSETTELVFCPRVLRNRAKRPCRLEHRPLRSVPEGFRHPRPPVLLLSRSGYISGDLFPLVTGRLNLRDYPGFPTVLDRYSGNSDADQLPPYSFVFTSIIRFRHNHQSRLYVNLRIPNLIRSSKPTRTIRSRSRHIDIVVVSSVTQSDPSRSKLSLTSPPLHWHPDWLPSFLLPSLPRNLEEPLVLLGT